MICSLPHVPVAYQSKAAGCLCQCAAGLTLALCVHSLKASPADLSLCAGVGLRAQLLQGCFSPLRCLRPARVLLSHQEPLQTRVAEHGN